MATNALKESTLLDYFREEGRVGIYIDPITSIFLRLIISLFAGLLLATIMFLVDLGAGTQLLNFVTWLGLTVLFAMWVGWAEEKVTVPVNHVAFVTFLGRRQRIYLEEGEYSWVGRRFFLGISRTPLPNAKNVAGGDGEQQGFVFLGNRTLQIWNDRKSKLITLTLPTRAGSTVSTNLTTRITTVDPMKWALSDDPILQIAEQARAGLRKALTFFRDTDVSGAKSAVVALISGKRVIASFTTRRANSYLFGTMVQDRSGLPLYEVVDLGLKKGEGETAAEFARREEAILAPLQMAFAEKVLREGNPEMVEAAKDKQGNLIVADLNIDEKLSTAVAEVGSLIENVVISDAQLSPTVRQASENAASEGAQREQQITSAETQIEVRAKFAKARVADGVTELDQLLAAAADGNSNVNLTHVTGANDSLTKGMIAAANQLKGKNK